MLGLFLDFQSRQDLAADCYLLPYTEAMAVNDDELLAGVAIEAVGATVE